jgi:GT2 family glycosyltransferase
MGADLFAEAVHNTRDRIALCELASGDRSLRAACGPLSRDRNKLTTIMKAEYPLVSIIILNYNQLKVTCECIDSARSLEYPNYEIIMVDNASSEDPTSITHSRYPEVRLIRNQVNLGFSGGSNVGIKAAHGDYFLIINNDTEVVPDLIERMLEAFATDPRVGVVSPKIRYYSHPHIIQYAGYTEMNPFTGRNKTIGLMEEDKGQFDTPGYTAYAHGAAMMVKREVVEKVGVMSDIFFMYYEELDWSARIRRTGYKVYYQPTALIFHKDSVSMGKQNPMKTYFHNRNRILFMRRNTNAFQFMFFLLFYLVLAVPKNIIKYARKGQLEHLRNFLKGLVWNLVTPKYARVP